MPLLPEIANWSSAHTFLKRKVSDKIIRTILNAGRKAPSIKNRQEWRFIIITDGEQRKKVANACYKQAHVCDAPAVIVLCTTNVKYVMPNGIPSYPVDIAIAASFMMLQARHEGLAVCPTTMFKPDDLHEVLSIPFSMRAVILLPIGHPPEEKTQPCSRKPLTSICSYDHW